MDNEAPAVVFTSFVTKTGFVINATQRDVTLEGAWNKLKTFIESKEGMPCDKFGNPIKTQEASRYDNRQESSKPSNHEIEVKARETQFCEVHKENMKQREWDGQIYFDHRKQIDGVWNKCRGRGWKADKPRSEFVGN